jgi:hypothetical protein
MVEVCFAFLFLIFKKKITFMNGFWILYCLGFFCIRCRILNELYATCVYSMLSLYVFSVGSLDAIEVSSHCDRGGGGFGTYLTIQGYRPK